MSKFGDVWRLIKNSDSRYKQKYDDLPGVLHDKRQFEKLAKRFGFNSDEFIVLMEPKVKDCNTMAIGTQKLCKQNPHETVLALFCYASHGMI